MACQNCQLEIPETLCQLCGYLEQDKFPGQADFCTYCGAPINAPEDEKELCHVCSSLLITVKEREWFIRARAEWEQENIRLANLKRELLR